jgi:hypothetical protein
MKEMEKKEFQHEKELKSLKKQLNAQARIMEIAEELREENSELKSLLAKALKEIQQLHHKLYPNRTNELNR